MKFFTKSRALVCALGLMIASSSFSLAYSLAWYAYSTRATVSYQGTAVNQSEQLQIGLISDIDFRYDDENVDLGFDIEKEHFDDKDIDVYWAKAGTGFRSNAIQAYLSKQGYATNTLEPVTTREYTKGDDLSLFQAPQAFKPTRHVAAANHQYTKLHFVFRIIQNATGTDYYVPNQNIWLTDARAKAQGENEDIREGLRLYFEGASKFVLNPTATGAASSTAVAGILDLNGDGYFDDDSAGEGQEIFYGDYSSLPSSSVFAADTDYVDPNGTGKSEESTFVARHRAGVTGYADYTGFTPLQAEYETLESIQPVDDGGSLSGGTPICATENTTDALAFADMTVYLEGWDHSVIDKEIGHAFDLGLQFQINRV